MDFLQSSFSGFFAAKLSRMAVTSTACAGAAAGEEDVAEAAGGVGLVGAAVPAVLVGEATAGEAGAALVVGAAVACPNIFDIRLINIPITTNIRLVRIKNQLTASSFFSCFNPRTEVRAMQSTRVSRTSLSADTRFGERSCKTDKISRYI